MKEKKEGNVQRNRRKSSSFCTRERFLELKSCSSARDLRQQTKVLSTHSMGYDSPIKSLTTDSIAFPPFPPSEWINSSRCSFVSEMSITSASARCCSLEADEELATES